MLSISLLRKPPEINPMDTNTSYNQEIVYYQKGEYDRAWEDATKAQSLGHQVHPEFLKVLREESKGERWIKVSRYMSGMSNAEEQTT